MIHLFPVQKTVWFCIFHSVKGFLLKKSDAGIHCKKFVSPIWRQGKDGRQQFSQSFLALQIQLFLEFMLSFKTLWEKNKKIKKTNHTSKKSKLHFLFCLMRKVWDYRYKKKALLTLIEVTPIELCLGYSWGAKLYLGWTGKAKQFGKYRKCNNIVYPLGQGRNE